MKIGHVQVGRILRVVLAVRGQAAALRHAARQGADLFEARVDQFRRLEPTAVEREVASIRRYGLPLIGTIRSREEGGGAKLTETARLALFERIAPLVDALDVEVRSRAILKPVIALARRHKKTLILSFHDLTKTPSDSALEATIERARALGADLIKVATFARSERDVVRLFQLTCAHRAMGLVTIAIGPQGTVSRLLFPLAGSLLTYTNVMPAHGQIALRALVRGLRFCYPAYDKACLARMTGRVLSRPPLDAQRMLLR